MLQTWEDVDNQRGTLEPAKRAQTDASRLRIGAPSSGAYGGQIERRRCATILGLENAETFVQLRVSVGGQAEHERGRKRRRCEDAARPCRPGVQGATHAVPRVRDSGGQALTR